MVGEYTLRVLASTNPPWVATEPTWIQSADVEAFDGQGDATLTTDESLALRFPNFVEAFEFWQKIPDSRPLRSDGEPNRPLTAFTIEVRLEGSPT